MLVLTRKKGTKKKPIEGQTKVFIGDDIVLDILEIDFRHGFVRLGFEAPKSVRIRREEVKDDSDRK